MNGFQFSEARRKLSPALGERTTGLDLDEVELNILRAVSDLPGITAKILGQKTHISAYEALVHAKRLVKLNLLTYTEIPSYKSGIKMMYSFYVVKDSSL